MTDQHRPERVDLDPVEFLRRALAISPDDAASVREDAAKAMERNEPSDAPTNDSGRPKRNG